MQQISRKTRWAFSNEEKTGLCYHHVLHHVFAIVRSALLCLRNSRKARKVNNNLYNLSLDIELDKML